jgi:hypothetical protein
MGSHQIFVNLKVPHLEVASKDVTFYVYEEGEKFGELRVSRGAIVWRGRKDKDGRKMRWRKFDQLMQEQARRAERRPAGARLSVPRSKRD